MATQLTCEVSTRLLDLLPQPPSGANEAGIWLLNAWNEAMGAIPSWPKRQPPEGASDGF